MQTHSSIFFGFFSESYVLLCLRGSLSYGNGSKEPGARSLVLFELRGKLLARKEFAGWAPSDKLWGKRIANSLE